MLTGSVFMSWKLRPRLTEIIFCTGLSVFVTGTLLGSRLNRVKRQKGTAFKSHIQLCWILMYFNEGCCLIFTGLSHWYLTDI